MKILKNIFAENKEKNKIENDLKQIFKSDDIEYIFKIMLDLIAKWEINSLENFYNKFWKKEWYNYEDIKYFNDKIDKILLKNQKDYFIENLIEDNFKKWFFYHSIWDSEKALDFYQKNFSSIDKEKIKNWELTSENFSLLFNIANIYFYKKDFEKALENYWILKENKDKNFEKYLPEIMENCLFCFLEKWYLNMATNFYNENKKYIKKPYFKELFKLTNSIQNNNSDSEINLDFRKLSEEEKEKMIFYIIHLKFNFIDSNNAYFPKNKESWFKNLTINEFFERNVSNWKENISNFSIQNLFKSYFFENNFEKAKIYYDKIIKNIENFEDINLFIEILFFENKFNFKNRKDDYIEQFLKEIISDSIKNVKDFKTFLNLVELSDLVSYAKNFWENKIIEEWKIINFLNFPSKNISFSILKNELKKAKNEKNYEKFKDYFEIKFWEKWKDFKLKTEEPYFSIFLDYFFIKLEKWEKNPIKLIEEIFETKIWENTFNEVFYHIKNNKKISECDKFEFYYKNCDNKNAFKVLKESNLEEKNESFYFYNLWKINFSERNYSEAFGNFEKSLNKELEKKDLNLNFILTLNICKFISLVELEDFNEAENLRKNSIFEIDFPINEKNLYDIFHLYKAILESKIKWDFKNLENFKKNYENSESKSQYIIEKIKENLK